MTDAVIQNNQPLFMFTWIGSIVAILTTIVASLITVGLSESWIIILVGAAYLLGVQGITVAIHIPLNNHIQKLNIDELNDKTLAYERKNFEAKWNFFNKIRTGIAISVSLIDAHTVEACLYRHNLFSEKILKQATKINFKFIINNLCQF